MGVNVRVPSKRWLVALVALVVVALGVFGFVRLKNENAKGVNTIDGTPTATATPQATTASRTPSKTPATSTTPVAATPVKCAKPGDLFNVAGDDVDTLPPDCGAKVVPAGGNAPLGLGCGGAYPTIMFKTTTAKSKTTICGKDSSGEANYMVTQPNGGASVDMVADYDPGLDAFVARKNGTTYIVEAYNGSLTVKKSGSTDRQVSKDWLSLDNEQDGD